MTSSSTPDSPARTPSHFDRATNGTSAVRHRAGDPGPETGSCSASSGRLPRKRRSTARAAPFNSTRASPRRGRRSRAALQKERTIAPAHDELEAFTASSTSSCIGRAIATRTGSTRFCRVVDFDTAEDKQVAIRDRVALEQERPDRRARQVAEALISAEQTRAKRGGYPHYATVQWRDQGEYRGSPARQLACERLKLCPSLLAAIQREPPPNPEVRRRLRRLLRPRYTAALRRMRDRGCWECCSPVMAL